MKFLKKLFKKKKKYKIILTKDEIFLLGPMVLMWIENWKKEMKEEKNCDDDIKEIDSYHMKNGFSILNKIKEANGQNKYWKKFWKKYKKENK